MSTTTQIDLNKFCESDPNCRYAINEPWVDDCWRYATDGRVLVRVPATGEPDSPKHESGKRRPRAADIVPPVDGNWMPWPEVERCTTCGSHERMMACKKCGGYGQCRSCKCGHEHVCGYCEGSGEVECDTCVEHAAEHLFGQAKLAHKYAYLIGQLPNVAYLPTYKQDDIVRFKFDGGEGAVSPLRQD